MDPPGKIAQIRIRNAPTPSQNGVEDKAHSGRTGNARRLAGMIAKRRPIRSGIAFAAQEQDNAALGHIRTSSRLTTRSMPNTYQASSSASLRSLSRGTVPSR